MNESIWFKNISLPFFPKLVGIKSADVLVIGGGLAGLLTAHMMKTAGASCILLEADRIMGGVSGKTTAKITSQHSLIYNRIEKTYGIDAAGMYLEANEKAIAKYRTLCRNIDCCFEEKESFVYSTNDTSKLEKEFDTLDRLGFKAEYASCLPLPFKTVGAIKFLHQAQFNPVSFAAHIANSLEIYEGSLVRDIIGNTAYTDDGKVTAKAIVVATHFPFINRRGSYFLKLYQSRSYEAALSGASLCGGMFVDENDKGMTFRDFNQTLIIGGGAHRPGKSTSGWSELEAFASRHYPEGEITHRWASQDCMSLDSIPYIGRYSKNTPNLFVATGFNKWGMTSSMAAAMILSDMIQGKRNPYEDVFSPSRTMMHKQLAANAFESTLNLLTPTVPRCPHMGCALKWNRHEHTWDCPCHGSRFDSDGKVIQNPAIRELKNSHRK